MFIRHQHRLCFIIIFLTLCGVTIATGPIGAEAMIGHYRLINEEKCRRLCWYRQHCTSYTYDKAETSGNNNCILYTEADMLSATPLSSPTKPASGSGISNGCKDRPCKYTEVCVPRFSSSPSSGPPASAPSHDCLPLPSSCGVPDDVPNGKVSVLGMSGQDAAHVTCNKGFVASPKNVPVHLVCLKTSRWTPFAGSCVQYYFLPGGVNKVMHPLPWKMEENSEICFKGQFIKGGKRVRFYLRKPASNLIKFVFWKNFKDINGDMKTGWFLGSTLDGFKMFKRIDDELPVAPGENFNVTLFLHSNRLRCSVNKTAEYAFPLKDVLFSNGQRLELWS